MDTEQKDFVKPEEKTKPKLNIGLLISRAALIAVCLLVIYYASWVVINLKSYSFGAAIGWAGLTLMVQFPVWIPVIATISLFVSWVISEYEISKQEKKEAGAQPQVQPTRENHTDLYAGMMGINVIVGVVLVAIFEALRAFSPELFCGVIRNGCRGDMKRTFDSIGMIITTALVVGLGYWLAALFYKKKVGEKKAIPLALKVSLVLSSIIIVVADLMIKNAIVDYYYY